MGSIKEINTKNWTYYFFDDMINIKTFDSNLLKIDKKSYKNIGIYCIAYINVKDSDYAKIDSVKPSYLNIGEVDRCIEENNWNKYLTLVSTDKSKDVLTKYIEFWDGIKNLISEMNDKPDEYEKDFMEIKFNSDDNLPLNKTVKLHNLT